VLALEAYGGGGSFDDDNRQCRVGMELVGLTTTMARLSQSIGVEKEKVAAGYREKHAGEG